MSTWKIESSDDQLIVDSIQRDLERWKVAHDAKDLVTTGRIRERMIQSLQDLGMPDWKAKAEVSTLLIKRAHEWRAS